MNRTGLMRVCPVCGEARSKPHLEKHGLHLVACAGCGMVYVNPVAAEYATGAFYNDEADYYLSPAKLAGDYSPVRFVRELRLFRRYCPQGAVLDVGCSTGAFLFQLQTRFAGQYSVLGTDVSGPPLDYADSRGVPVIRGDFLRLDVGGGSFDALTFWAVLEHLAEPRAFLERASELLKPGGLCVVLVPNFRSLAARCLGARYRYIYPQHLNYFEKRTLHRLVPSAFERVATTTSHFNPVILWQDWKSGGAPVSGRQRGELLQRTTAWKRSPGLLPVRALYRLAEACLAVAGLADNLVLVLRRK